MNRKKGSKGRLVDVSIGRGCYVKMYQKEAMEKGLLTHLPASSREQEKIKAVEQPDASEVENFTEIPGVGEATDRSLHEHGIDTYEQLVDCDVSFLSVQGQAAIKDWREAYFGEEA